METLANFLQRVIPQLKTYIQLSGLALGLAIFYLAYISNPPNLPAQITGGLIAVSVLVFTLSLNILREIPEGSRANFIISMFFIFVGATVVFLALSIVFLLRSGSIANTATATQLAESIRLEKGGIVKVLDQLLKDEEILQRRISRSAGGPFSQIEALRSEQSSVLQKINQRRTDLARLDALLEDLTRPNPKIIDTITDARRALDRNVNPLDIAIFNSAGSAAEHGHVGPLKELLASRQARSEEDFVRQTLDVAWLNQIDGDYETARQYYLKAMAVAPRSPRVLEAMADINLFDGDYAAALRTWDELIRVREGERPQNLMALSLAYKDRATTSWRSGDYDAARTFYAKAQDAYNRAEKKEPVILANLCSERAWFATLQGDFARANEDYQTSDAYFTTQGSNRYGFPHFLNNHGIYYLRRFEIESAMDRLRFSIEVQRNTIGLGTELNGTTLWNLALAASAIGDYKSAEAYFLESEVIFRRIAMNNDAWRKFLLDRAITRFMAQSDSSILRSIQDDFRARLSKSGHLNPGMVVLRIQISQLLRMASLHEEATNLMNEIKIEEQDTLPPYLKFRFQIEAFTAAILAESTSNPLPPRDGIPAVLLGSVPQTTSLDQARFFLARSLAGMLLSRPDLQKEMCTGEHLVQDKLARHAIIRTELNAVKLRVGAAVMCPS